MDNSKPHLISLGSSFGAGPGIQPLANLAAGRSTLNYPSILSRLIDSTHSDATVSGATLLNITTTSQEVGLATFAPQIESITPSADFVTITAGGNDMGYIGGMVRDVLMASEGSLAQTIRQQLGLSQDDGEIAQPSEHELVGRMGDVIDAVRSKAPKATILLVEYLTVLGDDTINDKASCPFTDEQLADHKSKARQLQRVYARAANGREGVRLIPIARKSLDHGIGCEDPWVTGFSLAMLVEGGAPFHPNARGMQAVAEIIHEDLKDAGLVSERHHQDRVE